MEYIAHIRQKDKEIQTVVAHLLEVKGLAEIYGGKIGVGHIAGLAGLLHDLGKYTEEFKEYILEAVANPNEAPKRGSVDHSTAGGKLIFDLLHKPGEPYRVLLAEIVGNAIISHHSYLQDFIDPNLELNYLKRVKEKELTEYEFTKMCFFENVMSEQELNDYIEKALAELTAYLDVSKSIPRQAMFLSKFIFSTLIDADRTNSREFEENKYGEINKSYKHLLSSYYDKLMKKINGFKKEDDADNPINVLRSEMSDQCEEFAKRPSDIYTLSIPTGGGKTLASLRYALKHAQLYDKKRIIYIVPYTTIIEQNADEVRKILDDNERILEHHSNVVNDELDDNEADDGRIAHYEKLKLAKDNWDAPIVFTTMVQYLDTFYAYGGRNIRRLHNLTDSILIFDEVQKVPTNCISLFNHSLNFLKENAKSSILLCTATQPALNFVNEKLNIGKQAEIISNIDAVVEKFKRVQVVDRVTEERFDKEKLVDFIADKFDEVNNILVILNTKIVVKDLYESLKETYAKGTVFHLSTSMCPNHRTIILNKIKDRLKNKEPVICISTQLIEAGVDISFECVIRSLAGLDSIAQAAGRCNRHGKDEIRSVYVINYEEENLKFLKEIALGKEIAQKILKDLRINSSAHGGSILSMQAMNYYFRYFYTERQVDLDYPIKGMNGTMIELLMAEEQNNSLYLAYKSSLNKAIPLALKNSYQTAARNFQVIDSPTTSIIVPYREGKELITKLNGAATIEDLSKILQKAQRYSISVYSYQLDLLKKSGNLTTLFDDQVYALVAGAYDEEYGLNIEGDSKQESLVY